MASPERGAADRAVAPTDATASALVAREVIVLATRNPGKVRELRALLAERGIACEDLDAAGVRRDPAEEGIEVHDTFEGNARAKATWFASRLPGRAVLAEDSGLECLALGGAPGVHSKRWAGLPPSLEGAALDEANNAALAHALEGHADRRARYRCVAVLIRAREWRMASGECEGRIVESARGADGFGYDPWFFSDELGCTFGEARAEAKGRVSHRARAIARLLHGG